MTDCAGAHVLVGACRSVARGVAGAAGSAGSWEAGGG